MCLVIVFQNLPDDILNIFIPPHVLIKTYLNEFLFCKIYFDGREYIVANVASFQSDEVYRAPYTGPSMLRPYVSSPKVHQ